MNTVNTTNRTKDPVQILQEYVDGEVVLNGIELVRLQIEALGLRDKTILLWGVRQTWESARNTLDIVLGYKTCAGRRIPLSPL